MVGESRRLEATETSVGQLLSDSSVEFVIPEYQRPYAWGVDESLQLLSDLTGALDRDAGEPYFLGSIVLVKAPDSKVAEVIDGQQRLTTLTLLLSVLRDLVEDDELRRDVHQLIEEPAVLWKKKPATTRLKIRPRDNQFFKDYVQSSGGTLELLQLSDNTPETEAQMGIRDNARAIHAELSTWSQGRIMELFELIGDRAYLVTVATPDLNSAYRIFSVMNSRGLPLSPQDIFKSQVIGAIHDDEKQFFAGRWERFEELLGLEEFGDLFLYIRTITSLTRAERSLLQEFPEQVLNSYLPDNGIGFIREVLEPYAKADLRMLSQDFQGPEPQWREVNNWLKRLSKLENDDWRPAALWALKTHDQDPEFLAAFLKKLERLAASLLLRRVFATPRQMRYLELLRQLAEGHGLDAASFELSGQERKETLEKLNGEIYLDARVRKYLLLRLDSVLAQDPGATYDPIIVTVEHVLPQTPPENSEWRKNFSDEEIEFWLHRLGNLVLLNRQANSRAQNFDFEIKKEKYFKTGGGAVIFALTSLVLSEPVWTPEVVARRHEELLALLAKEWEL